MVFTTKQMIEARGGRFSFCRRALVVLLIRLSFSPVTAQAEEVLPLPLPTQASVIANPATPPVPQTGALGPAALWDVYTGHLRAGRMEAAYRCFSKPSREVFSYRDFLTLYHPLTATSEAILSPANQGQLRLSGDMATFRYLATPKPVRADASPARPAAILVTALMVREENRWFLIVTARENQARAEAAARRVLQRLRANDAYQKAKRLSQPMGLRELQTTAPDVFRTDEAAQSLPHYLFQLESIAGRFTLTARPRSQAAQLRGFRLTQHGEIAVLERAEEKHTTHPSRAQATPSAAAPRPPVLGSADAWPDEPDKNSAANPLLPPPPDMGDPEKGTP